MDSLKTSHIKMSPLAPYKFGSTVTRTYKGGLCRDCKRKSELLKKMLKFKSLTDCLVTCKTFVCFQEEHVSTAALDPVLSGSLDGLSHSVLTPPPGENLSSQCWGEARM